MLRRLKDHSIYASKFSRVFSIWWCLSRWSTDCDGFVYVWCWL